MKNTKFTESQIIASIEMQEAGTTVCKEKRGGVMCRPTKATAMLVLLLFSSSTIARADSLDALEGLIPYVAIFYSVVSMLIQAPFFWICRKENDLAKVLSLLIGVASAIVSMCFICWLLTLIPQGFAEAETWENWVVPAIVTTMVSGAFGLYITIRATSGSQNSN